MYTVPHYINGRAVHAPNKASHPLYNPAEGITIGQVHFADNRLLEQTIQAALAAWPSWSNTPVIQRARLLFKFRQLLEQHQSTLAALVTKEHGKTLEDAHASIARAIELVEHYCGLLTHHQTTYSFNVSRDMDCYTMLQPLGVCTGISPFNFPVMVPIWMIIPAIACGNCFVLKPSEQAPSAPVRLLELLTEAGLPSGVAQCLHGDKALVQSLIQHPAIQAVTAVASTSVAKTIYQTAIAKGKRAHTFGGAKNHAVIMPDADLKQAANAIVGAAFGSAGERCMAISVVVTIGDSTADDLLASLVPLIKAIRVGPATDKETDMGPVISATHRQRIINIIDEGLKEGAQLQVDGRRFKHASYPQGFFLGPTLFDKVEPAMTIYQQEIFGPVLLIVRAKHLEEAIALINKNSYGNGAAIFTGSGYAARCFTQQVEVGMVGINVPIPVPVVSHPFGGWKASSFGDTNMHGKESIHFYTKRKTVTTRWLATDTNTQTFIMPSH